MSCDISLASSSVITSVSLKCSVFGNCCVRAIIALLIWSGFCVEISGCMSLCWRGFFIVDGRFRFVVLWMFC